MQRNNAKTLLYIAILSSTVVLTWIGTAIYYSLSTSTTPVDTNKYSTPISPSFDMTVLDSLSSRTPVPIDFSQKAVYDDTTTDTSGSAELTQPFEPIPDEFTSEASSAATPVITEQEVDLPDTTVNNPPADEESPSQ